MKPSEVVREQARAAARQLAALLPAPPSSSGTPQPTDELLTRVAHVLAFTWEARGLLAHTA